MNILVTGGAGYIGSTVVSALSDASHTPVILDSLVTGHSHFTTGHIFYRGDIADHALVKKICTTHAIEAVIHCAARIVVEESVQKPALYYRENCVKSLALFTTLHEVGVRNILFSSSASIYAHRTTLEVTEESAFEPQSPYARTKLITEYLLRDLCRVWKIKGVALRYFNPIGADPQLRSGPFVKNPTHVLGKLSAAALGIIPRFEITGARWPTRDGTGIRDYIHVWDLAIAHVRAVENFAHIMQSTHTTDNYCAINLGTGRGTTVRELHHACQRVRNTPITAVESPPRPGDGPGAYANYSRAAALLHWSATKSIEEGISDLFRWLERRRELLGY